MLTTEELLAGGTITYEIEIPSHILNPGGGGGSNKVRLRPLTIKDVQLISRAAKEKDELIGTLMVQRALVEPQLSVAEVTLMQAGLVQFLLHEVNRISSITTSAEQIALVVEDPLAKAAFILAKEFGWTPQQISELTLGQVLVHLQMLKERAQP
jgi:hypothetical protein